MTQEVKRRKIECAHEEGMGAEASNVNTTFRRTTGYTLSVQQSVFNIVGKLRRRDVGENVCFYFCSSVVISKKTKEISL